MEKTYQVEVAGALDRKELEKLRHGVHLAEGFARVVAARVIRQYKNSTQLEIVLAEGRNREIRRLLARVGHKVERLKRIAIGPLRLGELPPGAMRPLDRDELRRLRQAARGAGKQRVRRAGHAPPREPKPARPQVAKPPSRVVIGGSNPSHATAKKPQNNTGKTRGARKRPAAVRKISPRRPS